MRRKRANMRVVIEQQGQLGRSPLNVTWPDHSPAHRRMYEDEKLFAQMWDWEFPELRGQVVARAYAFSEDQDDAHPEKVLLELLSGQNHSFFMSGGSGCWQQLDKADPLFEREVYEDARMVDYTERFGLRGQVIERVWCQDSMPLMIQIKLSGGLLTLTEGVWNGPTTPDVIRFLP